MRSRNLLMLKMLALPLLALGLVVGACNNDDSVGPGSEKTGSIRVILTDAPYPFDMIDSAVVVIDSVSIHLVGDAEATEADGFRTIDRTTTNLNLLDLQGGTVAVLAKVDGLPVGEIDQIRLHVREASVTLTDQRVFPLEVPSGSSSGIKVFPSPPIDVVGGFTTEVLLDFDVSQSFSPIPNAPNHVDEIREFVFHPVIRVAVTSLTGSVSGTIWNGLGTPDVTSDDVPMPGATVRALQDGTEIATTASDENGRYVLAGLHAGTYTVRVEAAGFVTQDLTVTVVAGSELTAQDFRIQPS